MSTGYQRKAHLRRKYGLTIEAFYRMVHLQRNACAICGQPNPKPNVDHCHKTGQTRGLLCRMCNLGLGHFLDNPDLLERAAVYLRLTNSKAPIHEG